jgi:predicted Zn finger-like uncharacterized protein
MLFFTSQRGCAMAIAISCPKCHALFQLADTLAGKKVKCQRCREVFEVPACATPEPALQGAVAVTATTPKLPVPGSSGDQAAPNNAPAAPPPLKPRMLPRQRSKPASPGSSLTLMPVILVLLLGGFFFVGIVACGGAAWFAFSPREAQIPNAEEPMAQAQDQPVIGDIKGRDQKKWNDVEIDEQIKKAMELERGFFKRKEELKRPRFDDKLAQKIALQNGKLDLESRLDANDPLDPNGGSPAKLYLVSLQADQIYVVEMKRVGNDFFQPLLRVESPDNQEVPLNQADQFGDGGASGAFIAPKTGQYRIIATAQFQDGGAFSLRIRQIPDGEPLPANIKLPSPPVPRHSIVLARKIDPFLSAAIAHDSKSAWVAFPGGKLQKFSCPDFEVTGTYQLAKQCYQLAMDRRGILYAVAQQTVKQEALPWWGLGIADLHLYDTIAIAQPTGKLMPTKTIPLRGIVYHLYVSPDDSWLYYFDSHNRKVGRLELKTATIDRENDEVVPGTNAMCMAPNGKKLYTCSATNAVQVLDAATLKIERTFKISDVRPNGIQATDAGYVFLNPGQGQWTSIYLVNTNKKENAMLEAIPWAGVYQTHSIRLAPDQKRLFTSCFNLSPSNISSIHISERPALFKGQQCASIGLDGVNARGLMEISRDGSILFCDRGLILSIGR